MEDKSKGIILTLLILSALGLSSLTVTQPLIIEPYVLYRHKVYYTDASPQSIPGAVYKYVPGKPKSILYTRNRGFLHSVVLHWSDSEDKIYFVDANEYPGKIYVAFRTTSGWHVETVYEHNTYIRDIAWGPGTRIHNTYYPGLYFSEASGAGSNGKIYKLTDKGVELYYEVKLEDVDGFWAGYFTFADNVLYLSSGNIVPASIYMVKDGRVSKVFTVNNGSICGIHYVLGPEIGKIRHPGFIYYADFRQSIYVLDLLTLKSRLVFSDPDRKWLSDVYIVKS